MGTPRNTLKEALQADKLQRGLWLASASPSIAELAGGAGFDWCLIDAEHAPNAPTGILPQLQALAAAGCPAAVRVAAPEVWMVKQVLDQGVQTVVVPLVHDAATAALMAQAMRYPPDGIRGIGAAMARATGYGVNPAYVKEANAEVCLFVQAESRQAVEEIDAILAVEGVDGVFIGPADLSADMGYPGNAGHPEVQEAMAHVYARIRAAGKIAGTITFDPANVPDLVAQGVRFLGVSGDIALLRGAMNRVLSDTAGAANIRG